MHNNQSFLLSLVVPVYFEEDCITEFIRSATRELAKHDLNYEMVFVDDGSEDNTVPIIKKQIETNKRIRLVEFSRNQGKAAAITAAISYARGDYLLYMDPDLQDPPEEIIRFVTKIREGYDLVFGVREQKKDSLLNRFYSHLFWFLLDQMTGLKLPRPLAVMRIFSRRFADSFLQYGEANRFIEGIFMQVGMNRTQITIPQRERFAGESKFNFHRKMQLAATAIFDFSDIPLKTATRFGALLVFISLISASGIVVARLFFLDFQVGWPSIATLLTFGFGIQLFFLGIIGIYIGNIYRETKRRPVFSVKQLNNIEKAK